MAAACDASARGLFPMPYWALVAAPPGAFQFLHGALHGFLHAEGVGTLARREVHQTLEMRREEWASRRRRPELRCEELAALIAEFFGIGSHLLHWIHQQIRDVGHTRVRLLIEPTAMVLDTDVHF